MRKLKILHVIGQLGLGGAEKQLLGLCARMDATRYENRVLCYWHMPDGLESEFEKSGIKAVLLHKTSMSLGRFFLRLRHEVKTFAPDIVHTWLYSANFWGRWAAVTCGVPHVVASDRSEKGGVGPLYRIYEKLLARRTVRLVNSVAVARFLERECGLPLADTKVIHNAVDIPNHDRAVSRKEIRSELGVPPSQKLVVMVARQTWEKNYPMFVSVGARLCRFRDDVTFVSVGRGMMMDELMGLAATLGVGNKVRFVGQRDDVPRWLGAADVFCFTSNTEGFPNAVLEAMAAALPVVSTDFPSAREVIANDDIGVIVPLGDEEAMVERVERLLEDEASRHCMGKAAAAWVQEHYSWDKLVTTMQAFYSDLCCSRQPVES